MVDGLWVVQYVGMQGSDNGVIVLTNGKVLGGDNGFTYIGTYEQMDNGLKATVKVHNFDPKISSVLSFPGGFTVQLDLRWEGEGTLQGQGTLVDGSAVGLVVKLTKQTSLP